MFTVDSALQHTCASFREQVERGEITGYECDLLIDGAILLASSLESLVQDAHMGGPPSWSDAGQRPGRHVLAASGTAGCASARRLRADA